MPTNNNFLHPDRCGVTVAGVGTVRLFPDSASIAAAVSCSEPEAKDALTNARTTAAQVQAFLKNQGIRSFSASRITLTQEYRPNQGDSRKLVPGYKARIGFNIKLADLDQVDDVVSGLIAAGANELLNIAYQSSVIQEARNDARRQAINAAKDKANLYCQEVGVTAGKVLGINEVFYPAAPKPPIPPGVPNAADPTELSVGATVEVTFEIIRDGD